MERTLVMVKPDAVRRKQVGEVIRRFETAGLTIRALRMVCLDRRDAEGFYQVHRERPFFASLTQFMSSGPMVAMVLEGPEAISRVRQLMGATDPAKAEPGTIRRDLATSIEQNVVHGSDSPESATYEIPYFFSALELCP
ncbi:MAG: nucleoside-diphosphate kinase [candidate division NC10 bacterium]|nr:nucleoside-diphosphate kinase [candidate division NC10 bacterium]MBI2116935.1 nucleoside-diphosphate kinase [candidate division NC10 bacterium]MBI3085094.1 nucleoside-diphosphate kinase [candidate division NC10 bacterium]MBI3122539.1 nucleoside-diphosphate kinase [candidate division NC10 bacterium]